MHVVKMSLALLAVAAGDELKWTLFAVSENSNSVMTRDRKQLAAHSVAYLRNFTRHCEENQRNID